jgi:hypothetical protein
MREMLGESILDFLFLSQHLYYNTFGTFVV